MTDTDSNNDRLPAARYRFATTEQEGRLCRMYVREVSVIRLNFKNGAVGFRLLCKKYLFEDPGITLLIRKMACVFDVLTVRVDPGSRITKVENEKELQRKWERLKEELQKTHQGYEFENHLQRMDFTIYNKEKLIAFLESNEMYGLFLKGLWVYGHIDEIPQYNVLRTKNAIHLILKTGKEQYIFQNGDLTECLKITNYKQYEILCLG